MQDGFTSLMLVAAQEDSTDIVAALIEAKADPNIQDRVRVIVVLWLYPECDKMVFRGGSPRNPIVPHEGHNSESHSTAMMPQTRHTGVFSTIPLLCS